MLVCFAVVAPVSVIVTLAVDARGPVVGGTYRTLMVQLPLGAMTVPNIHVPPVIVKVPAPVCRATVGAAVRVNAPAFPPVAVLVTVMVPFFVAVPEPVVSIPGGMVNDAVPPSTVKVTLLVTPPLPFGVLTLMLWPPNAVPDASVRVAVTVVALTKAKLPTVMLLP